jgi:uncharacterized protein YprB with RNaseH-like and TPR domain
VSSLAERLRGIVPSSSAPVKQASPSHPRAGNAADVLGGEWYDDSGHPFLVVNRTYSPGYRHGQVAIADAAPPAEGWGRLHLLTSSGDRLASRYLFLDLETTGLAGGAGTYAFLVGLAWFDGCTFRVRQLFLAAYAAERVLLQAVREIAGETGAVVTYNGKSFDLPVLETRYILNRMQTPFADVPHVDMLHPARRLWRRAVDVDDREGEDEGGAVRRSLGARLTTLERTLCGHEREGDVPGFEIPARYFHYVRTGDARQLEAVLEHNRLDLLSLALLTARAAQLLEDGPAASQAAREALGLGQLYERAGLFKEARASFMRAAALPADDITGAEALRALALACRRMREYHTAADAWRALLDRPGCPQAIVREATEALAIHHEHRLRDPRSARSFALKSLRLPATHSRREALEHRLARLNRKLGEVPTPMPLF